MAKTSHTVSRLIYIAGGWARIESTHKRSDGEITPDAIAQLENCAVRDALKKLHDFGAIEPLLFQLEQGNPAILRNQEAIQVIASALQRKGVKGRGRKSNPATTERNSRICKAIAGLKELGYPIEGDLDKETACRIVGQRLALSQEQVFTIWNSRKRENSPILDSLYRSIEYLPQRLITPEWVPTTPDDVLQEFFPTKEVGDEAYTKAHYRRFSGRVINAVKRRKGNRWGL